MHVENITSNAMSLDRNGQSMLIQVYEKEIERLNNIIEELEKWCNNGIKNGIHISYEQELDYEDILDKLKALKENNNE